MADFRAPSASLNVEKIRSSWYPSTVNGKIKRIDELQAIVKQAKTGDKKVVLTNGCFDLIHPGHLYLLGESRKLGDLLVVAVNSDRSVKVLKGPHRPILPEAQRAELIAALEMVDYVILFDEPDPYEIIKKLRPNVLVKGGDWPKEKIVGRDLVEQDGGTVAVIPYLEGHSTTKIIERMQRN